MKKIYFSSDLHFCHNKDFIYKARGFNSIEEHDEELIERFNSIVTPEDDLWILGDLMLGDNDEGIKKIKQLNGNLHIIYGNHDSDIRIAAYNTLDNVVEGGFGVRLKYAGRTFYLSHYPTLTSNTDDEQKPLKRRVFNLCGHSHTQDRFCDMKKGFTCYHVELDAHDCYPVSIDEVVEDIKGFYKEC